jgi:hypothetical protein
MPGSRYGVSDSSTALKVVHLRHHSLANSAQMVFDLRKHIGIA